MRLFGKIICILLFSVLISGGSAATLSVQSAHVDNAGELATLNISLDSAPKGLSGYNITVTVINPSIANLSSVSFPGWAALHDNGTLPAGSCWIKGADTGQIIIPGSTNVTFATFIIQGLQIGSTNITIGINSIDDFYGDPFVPLTQSGTFTVGGEQPPASVTNLHNTSYAQTSITWAWTDPSSVDFDRVMVYLDGIFQTNVTKGTQAWTASSLTADTQHTIATHTVGTTGLVNTTWMNSTARTAPIPPVPPASITNLHNTTYAQTSITWAWMDPASVDFDKVMVYLDGIFQTNITKGTQAWTASSLTADTQHTIATHTVGNTGLINLTWVNSTARTAPIPPVPPASITNLHNTTYSQTSITWAWTDPSSVDFDKVMVYLDGIFQTNITKGTQTYTASSLTADTQHTVSTHTIGTTGLINLTWMNSTARTTPTPVIHPVANFTVNQTGGLPPLSVQFTDASTGTPPLTYLWNFGDKTTSDEQSPVHTYQSGGFYWPNLTVSNSAGNSTKTIDEPIMVMVIVGGDKGYYRVHCNVDGARVYLNDWYEGMIGNGTLTIQVSTTGTPVRTFTVEKEGYQTFTAPVTVHPGKDQTVDLYAELVPFTAVSVNLSDGWTLFSSPIQLEDSQSSWQKIFDETNQQQITIVLGWNGDWFIPDPTDTVSPLDAFYLKVNGSAQARLVPSQAVSSPPARDLGAGVSLIGSAPAYNQGIFPAMPLDQALISIDQAPGGKTGYIMVISPGLNQPGWGYAKGGTVRDILPFKGYWVVMENPDTLYGFSTTPI
jgi:PKD repeat protein